MVNLFNCYGVLNRGHHFNDFAKSHHNLTYLTDYFRNNGQSVIFKIRTGHQVQTSLTPIVIACHIHSDTETTRKDNENVGSYTENDFKPSLRQLLTFYLQLLTSVSHTGPRN